MLPCPYAKKCGGCSLQNLPYEEQLRLKQSKLIGLLGRFGRVETIIGMENPTHYRNKIQAAFRSKSGKVVSGVYQSTSRRIVEVEDCMLEDACAAPILATIRKLCGSMKIRPFDLESGRGFLRHGLIRRGFASGEIFDHELWVDADTYLPLSEKLVPTGEILSVTGTPFDFNTPKTIGRDFFAENGLTREVLCYFRNVVPQSL